MAECCSTGVSNVRNGGSSGHPGVLPVFFDIYLLHTTTGTIGMPSSGVTLLYVFLFCVFLSAGDHHVKKV
jgi:hypothetical protein